MSHPSPHPKDTLSLEKPPLGGQLHVQSSQPTLCPSAVRPLGLFPCTCVEATLFFLAICYLRVARKAEGFSGEPSTGYQDAPRPHRISPGEQALCWSLYSLFPFHSRLVLPEQVACLPPLPRGSPLPCKSPLPNFPPITHPPPRILPVTILWFRVEFPRRSNSRELGDTCRDKFSP